MFTLRILQSNNELENNIEEQEYDFFSQHIYKTPELSVQSMQGELKFETQISHPIQVHLFILL